jgi:hypothetical protein
MTKRKTVKPSPQEAMARLLRDAFIAAYCKINPFHDAAAWEDVKVVQGQGWLTIADEALRLGLRAPLPERKEDASDRE